MHLKCRCALVLGAVVACLCTGSLFAGSIYYASPAGTADGDGSEGNPYDIRTAIGKQQSNHGDEIRLLPGTYKVNPPRLEISYTTKLRGWGATRDDVIVDGQGVTAPFRLTYSAFMENLTVSNAYQSIGNSEAAVYVLSASISNCVFRNCTGTRTVSLVTSSKALDCLFVDNEGTSAGSTLYLTSGSVATNCTVVGSRGTTAAVNVEGCRLLDCVISNCYMTAGGGGATASGNALFDHCTIVSNYTDGCGGGIQLSGSGTCTILNSTVSNNVAMANGNWGCGGGGIYSATSGGSGALVMTNTHVCCNWARLSGGGIFIRYAVRGVEFVDCHIDGNYADRTCAAANYANDCGAAFWFMRKNSEDVLTNTFVNCTFDRNQARKSEKSSPNPILLSSVPMHVVRGCKFRYSTVDASSTVYMLTGATELFDCEFVGNTNNLLAADGNLADVGVCSVSNCLFASNYCRKAGVSFASTTDWTNEVLNCTFVGNTVKESFVGLTSGRVRVADCVFRDNVMVDGWTATSGGLCGCFTTAATSGEYWFGIDRCSFVNNTNTTYTGASGGCLFIRDVNGVCRADSYIRNCLFDNNAGGWHANRHGGSVYLVGQSNKLKIENCTFANHVKFGERAARAPVEYETAPDEPNLVNCAFIGNDVNETAAGMDHCWQGKTAAAGVDDDLIPLKGSPLIDQGLNDMTWMDGARDLRNKRKFPRIVNEIVDIGCYEYRPTPGMLLLLK